MTYALGIDIGGSGIKGAVVDTEKGTLVGERHRLPTPQPSAPEAMVATVVEIVRHFDWHGPVGCGFPALLKGGRVKTAANIDQRWIGKNVAALIATACGCPTVVLNDADAAGYGEVTFGAGRGHPGVVFVITIGTGIGTALIADGHLVPNTELGHLLVSGGHVEAEDIASDRARKELDMKWRVWAINLQKYFDELERLFSPDLFVIGGGVSKKLHKFEEFLKLETPMVPAQLLNEAGIVGAALAAARAKPPLAIAPPAPTP